MQPSRSPSRIRSLLERLEPRAEPASGLDINDRLPSTGGVVWHSLEADADGVLLADASPAGANGEALRLILATADGTLLTTSDGSRVTPVAGRIETHLSKGSYQLGVSGSRSGLAYHLSANITADPPPEPPENPGRASGGTSGFLNEDDIPDVAVANGPDDSVSLWLGNSAGTFQPPVKLKTPEGSGPVAVLFADVNKDGRADVVTANGGDGSASVFLAAADGSYPSRRDVDTGKSPLALAAGDLDGDGFVDLATASREDRAVSFLKGAGDGTFGAPVKIEDSLEPSAVAIADANGDGQNDLAWTSYQRSFLKYLPGGAGFDAGQSPTQIKVGPGPVALMADDVTRDGVTDFITVNRLGESINVLVGQRGGPPRELEALPVELTEPRRVLIGFVNDDDRPDLFCVNGDGGFRVLLGNGEGTFSKSGLGNSGNEFVVAVSDTDADRRGDLVAVAASLREIQVAKGNGGGTFTTGNSGYDIGQKPVSAALADVNADGFPDSITVGNRSNTLDVSLGDGHGRFDGRRSFPAGAGPTSVFLADLNQDNRLDAVCANEGDQTVSVLMGNGDGTFLLKGAYPVGERPQAVVVSDLDGDGRPDFVTAGQEADTLTIWWGNGDGTFGDRRELPTGDGPVALAVADIDRDGRPELISADELSSKLSVFGSGSGGRHRDFRSRPDLEPDLGEDSFPVSVAAADINQDGRVDLVAGLRYGSAADPDTGLRQPALAVWTQRPRTDGNDGRFIREQDVPAGAYPFGLVVRDLNGDRWPDLAACAVVDGTVGVALGDGDGTFQEPFYPPAGTGAIWLASDDLNRDGRTDLVSVNSGESTFTVLLGPFDDASTPILATPLNSLPPNYSPILADLDGDSLMDSVIRDQAGNILFRKGLADPLQPFDAPIPLNVRGPRSRDIAVYSLGGGKLAVASVDLEPGTDSSESGDSVYRVTRYTVGAGRRVSAAVAFATPYFPTGIAAGRFDNSGIDGLVVTHALDDRVTVAMPGTFDRPASFPVGDNPADVAVTDVNGDRRPDLMVTSTGSGDATVLLNNGDSSFTQTARYPLGTDRTDADDTGTVRSFRKPVGVIAGRFFSGGGPEDLAALLQGGHELAVLKNNDRGGFLNPAPEWATPTTHGTIAVDLPGNLAGGLFDGDDITDAAFLDRERGEVWVYRGDGNGRFEFLETVPAGMSPQGLTAFRNPATGRTDLYVGNPFGDVRRLAGNGRGHFEPPLPLTGDRTSLAVRGNQALVVNQKTGVASVRQLSASGKSTPLTQIAPPDAKTQQAPRSGLWANLNNGPAADLIVVGMASNDVVIYRALPPDETGRPVFAAPERYATGANPVAALAEDINYDGVRDLLVANHGSNDVSLFFGNMASGHWTAVPGPRVKSGGIGPSGLTLADTNKDGLPELIVTNRQTAPGQTKGSLVTLADRGFGYFDERPVRTSPLPGPGVTPPVMTPGGPVILVSGGLTGLDPFTFAPAGRVFGGGGIKAFDTFGNGQLAVYRNAGVELLTPTADGLYRSEGELIPLTGIPSEPTALEVLETFSGVRVFVTTAGSDRLFAFMDGSVPNPGESFKDSVSVFPTTMLPPGGVMEKATLLDSDSLAVVVTLLAAGLPSDGSGETSQNTEARRGGDDRTAGVQASENEAKAKPDAATLERDVFPPSAEAEAELERLRFNPPDGPVTNPPSPPSPPDAKAVEAEKSGAGGSELAESAAEDADPVVENAGDTVQSPQPSHGTVVWMMLLMMLVLYPVRGSARWPLGPASVR